MPQDRVRAAPWRRWTASAALQAKGASSGRSGSLAAGANITALFPLYSVLLLKLLLVASSVLLSTLAARRFGHSIGGVVAGMPMIAAPIIALLLLDHSPLAVRAIALATLACVPATILHIVTFATVAQVSAWPLSLAAALLAYSAASALLTHLPLDPAAVSALASLAPIAGLWFAAARTPAPMPVHVPRSELVLRIVAAVVMAAAIIRGADTLPASISGILLAVPITGTVLPCFTLQRDGAVATASLMTGFLQGLHGFTAFFVTLYWALGAMHPALAFCLALAAAVATAIAVRPATRFFSKVAADVGS